MTDKIERSALYYDGACPLCRREIAVVRRLASRIDFVDVHTLSEDQLPAGTSRPDLLRDLHFRHPDGQLETGLEANVALWQATPLGWFWSVLRLPLIRPVARRVYRRWADRRYERMGYCALTEGSCDTEYKRGAVSDGHANAQGE